MKKQASPPTEASDKAAGNTTSHYKKLMEGPIVAVCILLIILLGIFAVSTIIPLFRSMSETGGNNEEVIENYLKSENGIRGLFSLAAFQILQVISIFFPGAPIQIAGGLIYGTWKSFAVCIVSFVFANTMVFYLRRRNTNGILSRFLSTDSKRFQKVSTWLNSSDPGFMSMLAYMLPGIPNGFVPYVAARTNITTSHFAFSVFLGSIFQIFLMCWIGSQLIQGNWIFSAILVIVMIAVIVILFLNKNRIIALRQRWKDRRKQQ